jgi:hypothetical protein
VCREREEGVVFFFGFVIRFFRAVARDQIAISQNQRKEGVFFFSFS